MKSSVLEFRLLDDVFCFNTKDIDYVFELENYNKLSGFHESVIGITNYNSDVMVLIDTAKLYSSKSLDFSTDKSVVVVHDESGMKYGMIVDEIIKIEELDFVTPTVDLNNDDMIVNHYKDKDEIVNEIYPLPLLKKYDIPFMASSAKASYEKEFEHDVKNKDKKGYLLFKVASKIYAIDSMIVKEVLEYDSEVFEIDDSLDEIKGAIAVRDEVVKIVSLADSSNSTDILIVDDGSDKIALEVDEVYDIEYFDTKKIEVIEDGAKISSFYNHDGKVIAIFNPKYFLRKVVQDKTEDKSNSEDIEKKLEYLIFRVADRKFCVDMAYVRQVIEIESLAKTQSFTIGGVEDRDFLATWNSRAVSVFNISRLLGVEAKNGDDDQTIFVEYDSRMVAFIVQDIDDIVYLSKDMINDAKTQKEALVGGAILYNDEIIVKINAKYLCSLG